MVDKENQGGTGTKDSDEALFKKIIKKADGQNEEVEKETKELSKKEIEGFDKIYGKEKTPSSDISNQTSSRIEQDLIDLEKSLIEYESTKTQLDNVGVTVSTKEDKETFDLDLFKANLRKAEEEQKKMKAMTTNVTVREQDVRIKEETNAILVASVEKGKKEMKKASEELCDLKLSLQDYLQKNSIQLDYKGMILALSAIYAKNKKEFPRNDYDDELTEKTMRAVVKSAVNTNEKVIAVAAKKTKFTSYEEFFEAGGKKEIARLLKDARRNDLEGVDFSKVDKALVQLKEYENMPVAYGIILNGLSSVIGELPHKDKLWEKNPHNDIRAGVREALTGISNDRYWRTGELSTGAKIEEYRAEIDKLELENRMKISKKKKIANITAIDAMESDVQILEQASRYFKALQMYESMEVPTKAIDRYMTSTWLHNNKADFKEFSGWIDDKLREKAIMHPEIYTKREDVNMEIKYVPEMSKDTDRTIGVKPGTCRLVVTEKIKYKNQTPVHGGEVPKIKIDARVPKEFEGTVRYLAMADKIIPRGS